MPSACRVVGHFAIRVVGEELVEDDLLGEPAADRKGVADDRPLRFAEQAEDLSEVMDQAGEDEPARVAVVADRLGGLQQVFDLGELDVGSLSSTSVLRYSSASQTVIWRFLERQVFGALRPHEVEGLVAVVEPVELAHSRAGLGVVVAESPPTFLG